MQWIRRLFSRRPAQPELEPETAPEPQTMPEAAPAPEPIPEVRDHPAERGPGPQETDEEVMEDEGP
jgi:hypothetical protein